MRHNVSEIKEVIRDRRSIYPVQFSDRKVSKEQVEELLEVARWAPTHKLTQPWHFTVFIKEGLEKLATFQADWYKESTTEETFQQKKYDSIISKIQLASAIIAICMKRDEAERIPEFEEIASVACAVQNMHLLATAQGLAGYWSTGSSSLSPEMHQFLELNEKDRCLGLFYLGYPKIEWPQGQRRPQEYYTNWVQE